MPFGRRKKKRLPLPGSLSTPIVQTLKRLLSLRYFSMMPLQLISPNPCPPLLLSFMTLWLNICWVCSLVIPFPLSVTETSTESSNTQASSTIRPPEGVNLRALSVMVFIMNNVIVRSAFTTASVGFMSSVMPRIRYSMADFASTANSSSMQKLSICIMKSPLLSFIQSVSRPLYNSIVLRHSCTYSVSSFTSDGASTLCAIFSTSRFMRFIRGMTLEAKNTFARCSMFRLL